MLVSGAHTHTHTYYNCIKHFTLLFTAVLGWMFILDGPAMDEYLVIHRWRNKQVKRVEGHVQCM